MDLGIQHAMRMSHIVICGLSGSTVFFFKVISYTARFSKKKVIKHKRCVFSFSLQILPEIFLILERTDRDMIRNVH